ncbi:MAG TPA: hypothetical protein VGG85_13215 [Terracidiphilus sp.]|jgi:hypothetical protein
MPKLDGPVYLLRDDLQLPPQLQINKRKFRAGWDAVRSSEGRALAGRAKRCGWHLGEEGKPLLNGGQGETPEAATASALAHALKHIGKLCNVVRVKYLEIKKYPWFYLATVAVYPRLIRPCALPAKAGTAPHSISTNPSTPEIVHLFATQAEERLHLG